VIRGDRTRRTERDAQARPRRRSLAFQPPVELQIDADWALVLDTTHGLSFQTDLSAKPEIGTLTIATLDNISQTPCLDSGVAGPTRPWTPSTPADGPQVLMDWIESESGVPHSPRSPVTIDGHAGLETVLSPGIGSLQSCGGVVHLMSLGAAGRDLQIRENEAVRLDAIVVGDRTVVVIAQAPREVLSGDLETKADRIIGTIAFR